MFWKTDLQPYKIIKPKTYNFGTLEQTESEVMLDSVKFKVYKNNIRPRPKNKNHIVIFSCFSEFGSELVGCLYCIPKFLQESYLGYYVIVIGWHGREYLYRHLVDEFWELDSDYHWLREYCRAYHHGSKNLRRIEKAVGRKFGKLVDSNAFSMYTLKELYVNLEESKKHACWTPMPRKSVYASIDKFLKPNSVGVIGRHRKCYGRNLQIDFYKKLLDNLQGMGYNPIWIGEPDTTYDCPYSHITNFRGTEESKDLEKVLALISRLQFTIQFWTASTRLAGIVGTPFIIFESPDQIYGIGHEGMRLFLTTRGNKKIVISHFLNVYNDHQGGLKLVNQAIEEIKQNNWNDIVGLVDSENIVLDLIQHNFVKVHGSS